MDQAMGSIYQGEPRVDRHHLIICNTQFIFPSSWSHALLPSFQWSTQLVLYLTAGYRFISSDPLSMLLEPELLFLTNTLRMGWELCHFTKPWLCEHGDVLGSRDRSSLEMHLKAEIERVLRCSWRPWLCELESRDCAELVVVMVRIWRCT